MVRGNCFYALHVRKVVVLYFMLRNLIDYQIPFGECVGKMQVDMSLSDIIRAKRSDMLGFNGTEGNPNSMR